MLIIFGRRGYGRVYAWGSEWAQTSFAHLWYMPLFPLRSMWVRERSDGTAVALPARLSWWSIAATYARMWGPVVGIACLAGVGGAVGAAVGLTLLTLSAYAWLSRGLRTAQARRRSDFNLLAFGTRCDPALMTDELRAAAQRLLEDRHRELAVPRPPDDVARFGPVDLDEAVIAYGLLRFAALAHRGGAEADAVARLLAASHERLDVGDGPYRDGEAPAPDVALHAQAEAAAAALSERARARPGKQASPRRRNGMRIALALSAFIGTAALIDGGAALLPTRPVTAAELAQAPPNGRYVEVTCDEVSELGQLVDLVGTPRHAAYACRLGDHFAVLVTAVHALAPPTHVTGKLRSATDSSLGLPADLRGAPGALPSYIDVRERGQDLVTAAIGLGCAAFALGFGLRWLLLRRRARRA